MKFKIGDKVKYLDEIGEGIVKKIYGDLVIVEDSLGFEIPMKETKLILVKSADNVDEITENKLENIENTKSKNTNIRSDKSTKQFKDGIYLTIHPQNPNIPIASPHSVYLVNFTSMDIYFVLHKVIIGQIETKHGIIEKYSAINIGNLKIEDMPNEIDYVLQSIIISRDKVFLPFLHQFSIKKNMLLKEDNYSENPFFNEKSIPVLIRLESELIEYKLNKKEKIDPEINIKKSKERIINETSVIEKYLKTPNLAEVDLHLEKLVDNPQNISPDMALNVQLSFFKQCLESAIEKGIDKVVFIHGVGAGVLKSEMYKILKNYPDLYYGDAPIRQYGIGATEVYIKPIKI